MNALTIFPILLAVHLASASNLRGTENYTQQQQQKKDAGVHSRIFNGLPAAHLQFPYQVGLKIYSTRTNDIYSLCGGSLISREWVLTAAHCVINGLRVSVHIGSIELGSHHVEIPIHSHDIITHYEYNKTTYKHDIAVINIPTVRSGAIEPLQLPQDDDNLPSYYGAEAVVAGWGRTSDSSTSTSSVLQYTTLSVVRNKECANHFGASYIYPGKICTTARESSACFGDSGSPLVFFDRDHQAIQIGILSFVDVDGCQRRTPNAFTRITVYLDWIRDYTGLEP